MAAHRRFVASKNAEPEDTTLTGVRRHILKVLQQKYTSYVEQGKNLVRRQARVGKDGVKPDIHVGLALLEIGKEVRELRREVRASNDMRRIQVSYVHALPTFLTDFPSTNMCLPSQRWRPTRALVARGATSPCWVKTWTTLRWRLVFRRGT